MPDLGAFDSSMDAGESGTQTIQAATAGDVDDDFVRYQILRPVGEGGMGTVYLAEQREPIRRQVALKVVKLGNGRHQMLARFANERQALAMMDHPNIALDLRRGSHGQGPAVLRRGCCGVDGNDQAYRGAFRRAFRRYIPRRLR